MKTQVVFSEDFKDREIAEGKAESLRESGCKVRISKESRGWWHVQARNIVLTQRGRGKGEGEMRCPCGRVYYLYQRVKDDLPLITGYEKSITFPPYSQPFKFRCECGKVIECNPDLAVRKERNGK